MGFGGDNFLGLDNKFGRRGFKGINSLRVYLMEGNGGKGRGDLEG